MCVCIYLRAGIHLTDKRNILPSSHELRGKLGFAFHNMHISCRGQRCSGCLTDTDSYCMEINDPESADVCADVPVDA